MRALGFAVLIAAGTLIGCSPKPSVLTDAGSACNSPGDCPAGACVGGACQACPECATGEVCANGQCVSNTCVGIVCPSGETCVQGACKGALCGATSCSAGAFCDNGVCRDAACAGVVCPTGLTCSGGICQQSSCVSVVCDAGEACVNGSCQPVPCGTESLCGNAADDDCDRLVDCADPDCLGKGCTDGLSCTVNEVCGSAGCGGALSCPPPTDPCFAPAVSCSSSGCQYPANTGGGCDDSVACTRNDRCSSAGQCSGTAYTCLSPPSACHLPTGSCASDGGCTYAVDAGAGCTRTDGGAGFCQPDASCEQFPYPPRLFDPSNFRPTTPLTINCVATFDSTSNNFNFGIGCGPQAPVLRSIVTLTDGTSAVVIATTGLTITNFGKLTVIGSRPVVFAVYGDVNVAGTLLASSSIVDRRRGPGATTAALTSCGNGAAGRAGVGGGGGGSLASSGGNGGGGIGGLAGAGGDAGIPAALSVLSTRLVAGCRGGIGAGGATIGINSEEGLGGGAVQISASGSLVVSGIISVSGAGGVGAGGAEGGQGGGSAGMLALEASALTLASTSRLTAAGGGGAGGDGNNGQDGPTSTNVRADGGAGFAGAGWGGGGSVGALTGLDGAPGQWGGGGGGGAGLILLKSHQTGACSSGLLNGVVQQFNCP